MSRRALVCAALLASTAALVAVVGWPDLGRSLGLLTGRDVTSDSEFAFVVAVCWVAWLLLSVVCFARVGGFGARSRLDRRGTARTLAWSLLVLLVGATTLIAGMARHSSYRVCCASPVTAEQAERLVH